MNSNGNSKMGILSPGPKDFQSNFINPIDDDFINPSLDFFGIRMGIQKLEFYHLDQRISNPILSIQLMMILSIHPWIFLEFEWEFKNGN